MDTFIVYAQNPVVILVGIAALFSGIAVIVKAIRYLGGGKYEVDVEVHR